MPPLRIELRFMYKNAASAMPVADKLWLMSKLLRLTACNFGSTFLAESPQRIEGVAGNSEKVLVGVKYVSHDYITRCASPCSSQKRMSISRYIVMAVVSCSCAAAVLLVR